MRIVKLMLGLTVAISGFLAQGCSSSEETVIPQMQSEQEFYSRSNAQSMIDDMVATNTYLDYDFSAPVHRTASRSANLISEDEIITRVIWYRFYKIETVENNRLVAKGTADDIKVSQRAFDFCLKSQQRTNQVVGQLMEEGYSLNEALKHAGYNADPDDIESVIRLR